MLYDGTSHMIFTLTVSRLLKQQWFCAHNTLLTLIASKQADKWICTNKCNIFVLSLKHDINCIPGIIIHSPTATWNYNNTHIQHLCDIHFARKTIDARRVSDGDFCVYNIQIYRGKYIQTNYSRINPILIYHMGLMLHHVNGFSCRKAVAITTTIDAEAAAAVSLEQLLK